MADMGIMIGLREHGCRRPRHIISEAS